MAYRIETPRLVIRCYQPADAPLLKVAIDANIEHLRPWMPWIKDEPQSVEQKVDRLRGFRGRFDLDQDYTFGVFSSDERELLGGTGLHRWGGPEGLEIGYWVHVAHTRCGICYETVAAMTRIGFELLKLGRVEIRCDAENTASAGVPRKLGFHHDGTVRNSLISRADGPLRDCMVWTMLPDEYPASPVLRTPIRAYDETGRCVIPTSDT